MSDEPTPIPTENTPEAPDAQHTHAPAELPTPHAVEPPYEALEAISHPDEPTAEPEAIDHGLTTHEVAEAPAPYPHTAEHLVADHVAHTPEHPVSAPVADAVEHLVTGHVAHAAGHTVEAPHEPSELVNPTHPASETTPATPSEPAPPPESTKKWYVVKVQSNREDSIKAAIERKVKIEGLEEFYGQIAIPAEEFVEKKKVKVKVKDKKTGNVETVYQEKNVVKYRKKFPGYLFAEVDFNDRILYLFRETSGVGDFVGGAGPLKPPPPMTDREVQQMLTGVTGPDGKSGKKVAVKLDYEKGDKVRIKDGAFSGSEAEVKSIEMPKDPTDTPKVKVVVTIWGRPVEMDLDYWHVDKI